MDSSSKGFGGILTLDPGLICGWAVYVHGNTTSGFWPLRALKEERLGLKFHKLRHYLEGLKTGLGFNFAPDLVVYERAGKLWGMAATSIYAGIEAVITEWCEENSFRYEGVRVLHWRKVVVGKSKIEPEELVQVLRNTGWWMKVEDPQRDEVSALGMLSYAVSQEKLGG